MLASKTFNSNIFITILFFPICSCHQRRRRLKMPALSTISLRSFSSESNEFPKTFIPIYSSNRFHNFSRIFSSVFIKSLQVSKMEDRNRCVSTNSALEMSRQLEEE